MTEDCVPLTITRHHFHRAECLSGNKTLNKLIYSIFLLFLVLFTFLDDFRKGRHLFVIIFSSYELLVSQSDINISTLASLTALTGVPVLLSMQIPGQF